MRVSIVVIEILFIGALLIIANQNIHIDNPAERQILYSGIFNWFGTLYQQSLQITGYAVKSQWLPEPTPQNITNMTNQTK